VVIEITIERRTALIIANFTANSSSSRQQLFPIDKAAQSDASRYLRH
jgi:hypothetical protein